MQGKPHSEVAGNGDGTFQANPVNSFPAYNPAAVGIGDFNHDGKLDIAVAEQFGTISQVEIMLGNGDGSFAAGDAYSVGSSPNSVAVAGFRSDGKLDLGVSTLTGVTNILLGNGDGTFRTPAFYPAATNDRFLASGDFNGDRKIYVTLTGAGD
ncbi:MAG TPA: VCBS repeat-containing protein [Candidatus Binatia bacterium]|nr:VCBS repeat-containing protein [Candidatus Binatia bacterium]